MRMFSITPQPRMLLGVQNQKWNVTGALAELIDNSFGQGRGNADTVKITYDATDRTLLIADNGRGMEYIGQLFQLGNTIGHTAGDIGHFGSGGTQAIIWLADWVLVATHRDGKIMHDHIRWSEVFSMHDFRDIAVSNEWKKGSPQQFFEWDHGTAVYVKLLNSRKINVHNVIRDLSKLFAPGLRNGKKIIWVQKNGSEIEEEHFLQDPFEVKAKPENTVHFNVVVEVSATEHLGVHGVVSFDDKISHADSMVRIGFGYREIMRTRDCFKSGDEAFAGVGVSGWLDLLDGWQPYLSTTKDGFDNQPLYDALMGFVFTEIRDLLLKAQQKTLDFELDNIAIGIQMALEKTMKMKVKVTRERGESPGDRGGSSGGGGRAGINDANSDKEASTTAHIRLVPQTDSQMRGALARASRDPIGIFVDFNEHHPYVREAMKQRPINAAAINLMIVTEIATLLSTDTDLMQKAFKKSFVEDLEQHEGFEKMRTLVRHLIDSVPAKHQMAAE